MVERNVVSMEKDVWAWLKCSASGNLVVDGVAERTSVARHLVAQEASREAPVVSRS